MENEGENQDILVSILRSQRVILRTMKASSAKENLTLQQLAVIRLLQRLALPMTTLSRELSVSPPDVTGIVDRLEEKGLVQRTRNAGDRRKSEIGLTEKGREVLRRIQQDYRRTLQGSLRKSLTAEEQRTLAALLGKLANEIPA